MYVPPHFDEGRPEVLHALIEDNPLGILFSNGQSGLDANHIPFHLVRDQGAHGVLACHVARNNPLCQDLHDGDEVLVVFRAADAYISPQWYPSKQKFHKQVPSWNYLVAHAYGRATIHDDTRFVRRNVALLTKTHEASQPVPWKMGDAPRDFTEMMLKAIVGIEIEITRLVGKAKLSQNKEVGDIENAGRALNDNGQTVIGEAMLAAAQAKGEREAS